MRENISVDTDFLQKLLKPATDSVSLLLYRDL